MKLLAKTLYGLEGILEKELENLGAKNIVLLKRAVQFEGDQELLYRANLELRTALRILVPFAEFQSRHPDSLYRRIGKMDWSAFMSIDDTFAIDAVVHSDLFRHSKFTALRVKDAIVDQFRKKTGRRPNVDVRNPSVRISLHISHNNCTLSLDSSGDSLHKRGYRTEALEAPINEVLAAGMILLSGWQGDSNFIDPMCGSGTILVEAAYFAYNIAPQLYRREFGFMKWKDFDKNLWKKVVEQAVAKQRPFKHQILGFDKDHRAVRLSGQTLRAARLEDKVMISRSKFQDLTPPPEAGIVMMNPPYDERLAETNIIALYKMIGDRLKQAFPGFEAWIISSNQDALKRVGLKPSKKLTLFNGSLECRFQKFELYKGSKKQKYQTS